MQLTHQARITGELRKFVDSIGNRRALPTTVHIGMPGGVALALAAPDRVEAGLRTDLLVQALASLDELEACCVWLTRRGSLECTDDDLAWLAAARRACAIHEIALSGYFVLTRVGWRELLGDTQIEWYRVRPRRTRA